MNNSTESENTQALLLERSLSMDRTAITKDYDFHRLYLSGITLAKSILESEDTLFELEYIKTRGGSWKFKPAPQGKRLMGWARRWWEFSDALRELVNHEFSLEANPYVRLLLGLDLNLLGMPLMDRTWDFIDLALIHHLNAQITQMREQGRGKVFTDEVMRHRRHSRDSARAITDYLKALTAKRSKLLVLRVDFGYRYDPEEHPIGPRVKPSELNAHRQSLIQFYQRTFKGSQLGHVVKTEFGLYKGPHLHAIFILDGSKVRSDITIAAMLGEHWVQATTDGRGAYYNCNLNKSRYLSSGIGLVDYRNPQNWAGAKIMIEYITKPDYIVRVWAAGGRTLVKGWMPRPCKGTRGRPRTKQYGEAIAAIAGGA